ncbi:hypothetical protein KY345_02865 [Candidatus Woesearchaeota archaeon]|nr:hypothetical protein [Candidatus Woesearchaeota archaeon]
MKRIYLYHENDRYMMGFQLSDDHDPEKIRRIPGPDNEDTLKKLVEAYRSEGVEVRNGNLDQKVFDALSK